MIIFLISINRMKMKKNGISRRQNEQFTRSKIMNLTVSKHSASCDVTRLLYILLVSASFRLIIILLETIFSILIYIPLSFILY